MNIHTQLEANQNRRMAAENRFLERMKRREAQAEKQIGELVRDGKSVFYVFPQGGKYREGSRSDLTSFLIRNQYV